MGPHQDSGDEGGSMCAYVYVVGVSSDEEQGIHGAVCKGELLVSQRPPAGLPTIHKSHTQAPPGGTFTGSCVPWLFSFTVSFLDHKA